MNRYRIYFIDLISDKINNRSITAWIVHPKMNICWRFTHPQYIKDVKELVSSLEQNWRNVEKAIYNRGPYFSWKQWFEIRNVLMDLFITNTHLFTSQDVNWWTGVVWITCGLLWCFYQLLGLSLWRHPFTAGNHWRASHVMANFPKSVPMKKQTSTSWTAWGYIFSYF